MSKRKTLLLVDSPTMPTYTELYSTHWANNPGMEQRYTELITKMQRWSINELGIKILKYVWKIGCYNISYFSLTATWSWWCCWSFSSIHMQTPWPTQKVWKASSWNTACYCRDTSGETQHWERRAVHWVLSTVKVRTCKKPWVNWIFVSGPGWLWRWQTESFLRSCIFSDSQSNSCTLTSSIPKSMFNFVELPVFFY